MGGPETVSPPVGMRWITRVPDVVWRALGFDYFAFWLYTLYARREVAGSHLMLVTEAAIPSVICLAYVLRPPAQEPPASVAEVVVPWAGTLLPLLFPLLPVSAMGQSHAESFAYAMWVPTVVLVLGYASLWTSFSITVEARPVRTRGMYRHCRHPIYACHFVAIVVIALYRLCVGSVVLYVVWVLVQHQRARMEESKLAGVFPEYREYAARTPMYLPGWMSHP